MQRVAVDAGCCSICCKSDRQNERKKDLAFKMHCVAVCCSVLQCVAVCSSVTVRCSVLQCVAVCCSVLREVEGSRALEMDQLRRGASHTRRVSKLGPSNERGIRVAD